MTTLFSLSFLSSLLPSPLADSFSGAGATRISTARHQPFFIRCATSSSSSAVVSPKKRHWKQGEFPAGIQTSDSDKRRTPIKNIKKKLNKRSKAKAWANTVTEELSDCIHYKQWFQALQVCAYELFVNIQMWDFVPFS